MNFFKFLNLSKKLSILLSRWIIFFFKGICLLDGDLDVFINVRRWFDDIKSRPAVRKGIDVGKEARNFGEGISQESLKTMFKQDAKSIAEMAKKKEKK